MTLDQKIQIWAAIGAWISGIGAIAAAIVALHLARRVEKVRLKAHCGIRFLIFGDGTPTERHLRMSVTNLGERPVTIDSVGWAIGKRKQRRFAIQTVSGPYSARYPIELLYGKHAAFLVPSGDTSIWFKDFAEMFLQDFSRKSLKTLVAQIHTSVGQIIEVHPEPGFLDELSKLAK